MHRGNPKGVGRPKGAKGQPYGDKREKRWEPVKWRVDHEIVILMHCSGKTGKEIAETMGKTQNWVSLVINCKQAAKVIERIRNNLPQRDIVDKYTHILNKSADRLVEFIDNDDLAKSAPFAMADRTMRAIDLLDMRLKKLTENTVNNVTNNTLVLATDKNVDRLVAALDKSKLVTEKYRNNDTTENVESKLKLIANG